MLANVALLSYAKRLHTFLWSEKIVYKVFGVKVGKRGQKVLHYAMHFVTTKIVIYDDESSASSSLTFNITRMQLVEDHILFTAIRQCWTVFPVVKTTSTYMADLFISIGRMSLLESTW